MMMYKSYSLPLSVVVMDLDWHTGGWNSYTWNRGLFPDPDSFVESLHNGSNSYGRPLKLGRPSFRSFPNVNLGAPSSSRGVTNSWGLAASTSTTTPSPRCQDPPRSAETTRTSSRRAWPKILKFLAIANVE